MVKQNQPLQIRLTEPVIFLRGPSTGLDFRGRPQQISSDAQPAMLRGLLTLRLTKPTRIRRIEIKLEGKAKTEWPEGIGPRRLDTSEEHQIMLEQTTYFSAYASETRSFSTRRSASVGPGVLPSQWDLDDDEVGDDTDLANVPGNNQTLDSWINSAHPDRQGSRDLPRSASALAGLQDGSAWNRPGQSRRPSVEEEAIRSHMAGLRMEDRGPSPAYTVTARQPSASAPTSRRSSLRIGTEPKPPREFTLSPIASAAPSRATSDRGDSTSTERRAVPPSRLSRVPAPFSMEISEDDADVGLNTDTTPDATTSDLPTPQRPSILGHPHKASSGEVHFATAPSYHQSEPEVDTADQAGPSAGRAASLRTFRSGSTTSLNTSSNDHGVGDQHPVSSAVHAISAVSTAHNSPAPSKPPSLQTPHGSSEALHLTNGSTGHESTESSGPPSSASTQVDDEHLNQPPVPSSITDSPQRYAEALLGTAPRSGCALDTRPVFSQRTSDASRRSSINGPEQIAASSARRPSGQLHQDRRVASNASAGPSRDISPDGRGRKNASSKFSSGLHAAFDAMKGRVSSKSRSRAPKSSSRNVSYDQNAMPHLNHSGSNGDSSSTMSRGGSATGGLRSGSVVGSAIPAHIIGDADRGSLSRRDRSGSSVPPLSNPPQTTTSSSNGGSDFMVPYGRGGAARRPSYSGSSPAPPARTASPARIRQESRNGRSPSRARGRNKGMKVLTDALGLSVDGKHDEEAQEDVHNWKEFKKGTYNYPISFPIPLDAPPTLHTEFGSVMYRLKASVVRVGALTPNLVEEVEVTMIATPQEDDLEESENVIVERQWEEQMRYQIALSGKAFPIGGVIPISIRLMPLTKCKVHRLTVALEEKTDYYAQERKVARHETPKKYTLLFIKQPERLERVQPLLPILSEDVNAAKESPLAQLAAQAAVNNPSPDNFDPNDEDSVYASLLDPLGPWHLEKTLQVPDCSSTIKFTSKHEKTNIAIGHYLKVTIRVERGDDVAVDSKGKRKQFDIIIETPVKILDCRVNPQLNSLPTYTPHLPGSKAAAPGICSIHSSKHFTPLTSARPSAQANDPLLVGSSNTASSSRAINQDNGDSARRGRRGMSTPNGHPGVEGEDRRERVEHEDTLLERNIVYDRLMSGQETETGEVPPTYGEAVANAIRSASRSASRARPPVVADEGMVFMERGRSQSRAGGSRSASRGGRVEEVLMENGGSSRGRSRLRESIL